MTAKASIENEWPVVRLGDIATKIGSGATPTGGKDSYLPKRNKYALIRSQNVFDRRFDSAGLAYISDHQASRLKGARVQPGDLLFNITGDGVTFARACAAPSDVLPAYVNQHVSIIRVDVSVAAPGYVLAYLTNPAVKAYVESFNAGGSRRAVTKAHIESFQLPLPPMPVQRAISNTLGALDDKIELNRRMSEALEAVASALFKSMFVDFVPIRTKLGSGLPDYVVDLFPDSLVDSDVGEVPEGWEVGSFGDIVSQVRDPVRPQSSLDTEFSHYSLPAFDRDQQPVTEQGLAIRSQKWRVTPGAVLISKLNPEIERVWLVDIQPTDDAVSSTEFVVLLPRPPFCRSYVYCYARSSAFRRALEGLVTGTSKSHQRAQVDAILSLPTVKPTPALAHAFEEVAAPFLNRLLCCRSESRTLAALRDTLLPKLISGELRIKDAERLVSEVV